MRARRAGSAPVVAAVVLAAAVMVGGAVGVAGAAEPPGMLKAKDVGLKQVSAPHSSTVVAYDLVGEDCAAGEEVEHDARVAGFAKGGVRLNEVVYSFPSKAAAAAFFAEMQAQDQARADCGQTENATILSLKQVPKGVGTKRFTVVSDQTVNGVDTRTRDVHVLAGKNVVELLFLNWGDAQPSVAAVADDALGRLDG